MRKIFKFIYKIIIIIFLMITIPNLVGAPIVYNLFFDRYDPNYNLLPGIVNYEEIKDLYPREEISFSSNENLLMGYYYERDIDAPIIVMSHGISDGADSLLAQAIFFIDNGYNVFSYDNSGCVKSSGYVNGFTQSVIDLESALNFLNDDERFASKKKLLFGFSWGGFASTAIFNYVEDNIYGSVSISGYNDSKTLIATKGKSYVGPLVYTGQGLVNAIQNSKFGSYTDKTAIDGINNVNIPIFIAHGLKDSTIRYEIESILYNKKKITNDNVRYYFDNYKGHTSILYSDEAVSYQIKIKEEMNKKSTNEEIEFLKTVDDKKYSELNSDLFDSILKFYDDCLKGR